MSMEQSNELTKKQGRAWYLSSRESLQDGRKVRLNVGTLHGPQKN